MGFISELLTGPVDMSKLFMLLNAGAALKATGLLLVDWVGERGWALENRSSISLAAAGFDWAGLRVALAELLSFGPTGSSENRSSTLG